jgi:thymidylate synthase (FAD)
MNNHKNEVELLGYYGNDQIHACSAWTSTSRDLTEDKKARVPKLLKMLASEGHHTPFEKSSLHFLVNSDIASHIHKIKHRIGVSVNAESARYKELKEDKCYLPEDWENKRISDGANKAIFDYFGENFDFGCTSVDDWKDALEWYTDLGNILYHKCLEDITPELGRKRAKESARFFKTYNSQIQADVMFNFRSFVNFQRLRNSEHAQVEIREIAAEMLRLVKEIPGDPFKYTIEAFGL